MLSSVFVFIARSTILNIIEMCSLLSHYIAVQCVRVSKSEEEIESGQVAERQDTIYKMIKQIRHENFFVM